jgi:hypothetical protein
MQVVGCLFNAYWDQQYIPSGSATDH